MSEKKPIVLPAAPPRVLCPVCGKASYSSTGMHPQCAVVRADSIARALRKAAGVEVSKTPRKSWAKTCPKCKRQIPARRIVCDCGHKFATMPAPESAPTPQTVPAAAQQVREKMKTAGRKPR